MQEAKMHLPHEKHGKIINGCFITHRVIDMSSHSMQGVIQVNNKKKSNGFFKTTLNGIVLLVGLGSLSSPYALFASGWTAMLCNILIGLCYMRGAWYMFKCQEKDKNVLCYQDLAYKTLSQVGQILTVILFYVGTLGSLVAFSISVADNLSYIFPNPNIGFFHIRGRFFFILISSLIILPTTWMKTLNTLSFLSFSCILCFIITVICLLWIGITNLGFDQTIPLMKLEGIPVAMGIFAYSYGGNGVFPTLYTSMKDKSRFPEMLIICYITAFLSYSILGIMGVLVFGDLVKLQITLSMPTNMVASKIALWATVATPILKFSLILSPIAMEMEDWCFEYLLMNERSKKALALGTLLRTMLLVVVVVIASIFPYFGYMIGLVGSATTATICCILPCVFYLRSHRNNLTKIQVMEVYVLITTAIVAGAIGTVVSLKGLIETKMST